MFMGWIQGKPLLDMFTIGVRLGWGLGELELGLAGVTGGL